jgi:hypothetical protein
MQVSRAKSPVMKRIAIVCFTLLSGLHVTAVAKSITCTHLQDQELWAARGSVDTRLS